MRGIAVPSLAARARAAAAVPVLAVLALSTAAPAAAQGGPAFACGEDPTSPPPLSPVIPSKVPTLDQDPMNCFGWQQFIALNWPADTATCAADPAKPASSFGDDSGPVVWETYKARGDVFRKDADPPAAWCASGDRYGAKAPKRLSHISKFAAGAGSRLDELDEVTEAFTDGAWLTAQSGKLTLYEIRLNEDEFAYISENELYDATAQAAFAKSGGIHLPDASAGGTGAIELKAAWLELGPGVDKTRYLTQEARVTYPGQDPQEVTVGLTGLHIIHKLAGAQQFVWSTFEHVDNAPDLTQLGTKDRKPPWTYFDPACDPRTDHYGCAQNKAPTPGTDPYSAPVQVVRVNALDDDVETLNEAVWAEIGKANPDSVFLNYRLIDVLWPGSSRRYTGPNPPPLTPGNVQPPSPPVVNTTLETYHQDLTCMACHRSASGVDDTTAADYSFVFDDAGTPATSGGDGVSGWAIAGGAAVAAAAGAGGAVALRRRRRGAA